MSLQEIAKYFMGGEGGWDHVNSCLYHARNWYCAHNHFLRALESICTDAGYSTKVKMVLTSEGNRRAILKYSTSAWRTDFLVDVTLRHDFIGAGRDMGQHHGRLRNPDNPDHILESAAAEKILSPQFLQCLAGLPVYLGPHPRRILAPSLLPRRQEGRRLF